MTNNNPWGALDAATGEGKLLLDPAVRDQINTAFSPYQTSLQTLIGDALDDTTGYFGRADKNPLARLLQEAFNARGSALTTYLEEQLAQTQAFVKTAHDAAVAFQNAEND
jgi:hypothetical protein